MFFPSETWRCQDFHPREGGVGIGFVPFGTGLQLNTSRSDEVNVTQLLCA
jgi:hypothetical protein